MKTITHLLLSAAILLATPFVVMAAESMSDELIFEASLDDKPIGVHRFWIRDGGGGRRIVQSQASFDVSILFVPVYRYRHDNTEIWQDGCLQQIESETDANGTRYSVDLSKTAQGYQIAATAREIGTYQADCMMSFAYWDQRFLRQNRLLNTQTGELIPVEIQALGPSKRKIANRTRSVEGFRIYAELQNIDITVFYDSDTGRWVALESMLEGGRKLRYTLAEGSRLASAEPVSIQPASRK